MSSEALEIKNEDIPKSLLHMPITQSYFPPQVIFPR